MPDPTRTPDPGDALRDLFAADRTPDLALDVDAVLDGGRRRVQRRRTVGALGGTLAALAVAGGIALGVPHGTSPESPATDGTVTTAGPSPTSTDDCSTTTIGEDAGAGAASPEDAVRGVHPAGYDTSGRWRELTRTDTEARLYQDGVWVDAHRTSSGWSVRSVMVCRDHTESRAASASSALTLTGPAGTTHVDLEGDESAPVVRLRPERGAEQALRPTTTKRLGADDVLVYRSAAATVLLVRLGDDADRQISAVVGLTGRPVVGDSAGVTTVGSARYAVQLAAPTVTATDLHAVYRESGDGDGGWGHFASSTKDTPTRVSFDGNLMSPVVTAFPKDGVTIASAAGTTVVTPTPTLPSWTANDVAMDGTHRFVAVLPAGAKGVSTLDLPDAQVSTQAAGAYVVALVEVGSAEASVDPGRLTWTDAQGASHVLRATAVTGSTTRPTP